MRWWQRWIATRRALSRERLARELAEQRAAALAEILAAYRDALERYQSYDQLGTAGAIVQRESMRGEA